jgi:FeS assembly SUF system protein
MSERSFSVEEVSEATPVPKQPPLRAAEGGFGGVEAASNAGRTPDYLDGFLAKEPETVAPETPGGSLYDEVILALRQIFDPEIPVNIYDLGLIYNVDIADGHCLVTMTLTTPHCPVAETMPGEVEMRVMSVPGVASAEVALVWDPPWDPGKMSDEAKLEMGML